MSAAVSPCEADRSWAGRGEQQPVAFPWRPTTAMWVMLFPTAGTAEVRYARTMRYSIDVCIFVSACIVGGLLLVGMFRLLCGKGPVLTPSPGILRDGIAVNLAVIFLRLGGDGAILLRFD